MSNQLTYESVLELIRENSRKGSREIQKMRRLLKEQSAEFQQRLKEQGDELRQQMKERYAEYDRVRKETNKKIGDLGNSVGRIIEHMLGERIIEKFQALGYRVEHPVRRNCSFMNSNMGLYGEFDLSLVDTDLIILISVKTTLETKDVRRHLEMIEEYRRHIDAVGFAQPPFTHMLPTTRFIGAVAGAVVEKEAMDFAHANGLYTIAQSGDAVEIVPTPEGFQAKVW